nr:hypothetical protein [Tanacetum cinerariifolium]
MSDASSAVTYTSVYIDYEPWRYYREESADVGSPGVIVYGYDGLPMQPVASLSPDYVPGPKHPPSPDYVPSPEGQPLPADASPTAASPGYVADFDLEEDPEDDHADYPADGWDGDDEPSDDDDTDDEDEEPFEESSLVPIVDPVLPTGDTKALEADEPT